MQLNRFHPVASVVEGHAILIDASGSLVYAGPLSGIDEVNFNRAVQSFVHPVTLAWIKARADQAVNDKKVRLT